MKKILVVLMVAAVLAGCGGIGERNTGGLEISIIDGIQRAILPGGVSLEAGYFHVVGLGTTGAATGKTFTLDLAPGEGASLQLAPGSWSVTATAFNDDTPAVALGEGSTVATVVVGTPASANIVITEYAGNGTLAGNFQWWPDVVANPEPKATLLKYGGSPFDFPLTLDDSTHAHGSMAVANGWYTGFFELRDNSVLACGIARAIRILKDATTTWGELIEISLLDGSLVIDLEYHEGLPLIITTNPVPGEVLLYDGEPVTITVTGANQDAGHGLIYAWYLNGQPTSLGAAASFVADPEDFAEGSINYLSVIVYQDDGKRAGDATFLLRMSGMNPARLGVSGGVYESNNSLGVLLTLELVDADTHNPVDSVAVPWVDTMPPQARAFDLGAQEAGNYHLRVVIAAGGDFPSGKTSYWITNSTWTADVGSAGVLAIPHAIGETFTFPAAAVTP